MLLSLGPGLITGASDDDPSGIGTYAVTGTATGYATLWLAPYTLPMVVVVQYMCAKIGMVTGRGLAGAVRERYSPWVLYPAVLAIAVANTINAGADIGAIAAGLSLLVPMKGVYLVVPVGLLLLALQIWVSYPKMERVLKWLTLALFAYIAAAFFTRPDWGATLHHTFVPLLRLDGHYISLVVAVLGTTISPYMFFWQASQEVEKEMAMGRRRLVQRKGATDAEMVYMTYDVNVGMLVNNLVMFFIILTTAATLFRAGQTHVTTAVEAAQALVPFAGRGAEALLAAGLIGAGALAVPVLTGSAGYSIAEALKWRSGLDLSLREGRRFYGVIAASTLLGLAINFTGISLFDALVLSAIINGVIAGPLLVVIILLTSDPKVMKERANGTIVKVIGWITAGVMTAAAVAMFATLKSS